MNILYSLVLCRLYNASSVYKKYTELMHMREK